VALPAGHAQWSATVEVGSELFDLRFYGSDEVLVASWWIGVFDESGELRTTAIAPRTDLSPSDLTAWLEPIVGLDVAERLVKSVADSVARTHAERELASSKS
jgi:hypothetical protein